MSVRLEVTHEFEDLGSDVFVRVTAENDVHIAIDKGNAGAVTLSIAGCQTILETVLRFRAAQDALVKAQIPQAAE